MSAAGADAAMPPEGGAHHQHPKGLIPKHVFDITMSEEGVKLARGGRLAAYKAAHAFILAAASVAQGAAGGGDADVVAPEDLVSALDALGLSDVAADITRTLERDRRQAVLDNEAAAARARQAEAAGAGGPAAGAKAAKKPGGKRGRPRKMDT